MSGFKRRLFRGQLKHSDLVLQFLCVECGAECAFIVEPVKGSRMHMAVRHREPSCTRFASEHALDFLRASLPQSIERLGGTAEDLAEVLERIETLVSCGTLTESGPFTAGAS